MPAQTLDKPVRAVTDPGVVTTRQAITPAGVPTIFQGRVYGIAFGANSTELWVLNASRVYRLDWKQNRVIDNVPLEGTPGLQGIRFDAAKGAPLFGVVRKVGGQSKVELASISGGRVESVARGVGETISGALALAQKPNAKGQRIAVVPLTAQNKLAVVDLAGGKLLGSVSTSGIAPFGTALNKDGSVAYVTNWGGRVTRQGDITAPTGLAPAADRVVVDSRGVASSGTVARLDLISMTATHTIPVELHPTAIVWDEARKRVAVVSIPGAAQLADYSTVVAENNRLRLAGSPSDPELKASRTAMAVPRRAGDPSTIEHVVYIVKENRTYDQVLGDVAKGNGDASLVMFGEEVTPNHHRLAEEFVLLDNFYATGGNSADGHQWLTQAYEVDYCLWPGYAGRSYPFDGSDPIAYSDGGFLWDLALKQKKSVRIFGEYAGRMSEKSSERLELLKRWDKGESFEKEWNITAPIASINTLLARDYPSYSTAIPDVIRARIFLEHLKKWEAEGKMPSLTIIQLPSDHTFGTTPGVSSPKAMLADNDYALGQIVDGLTHSPFWKKMAILVVEDDAQNGVDHVDGHRTVALAISPFSKRGTVDSTFYAHQSMLKTIELILGLPAVSLFDLIANDMRASFTDESNYGTYTAIRPTHSLFEINPRANALKGEERRGAVASAKMRWDVPDAVPSGRLNRILWHSTRGWQTPYPGTKRAVFSPLSLDTDDDDE